MMMKNNRFVLDNNILVSALLIKNSPPFQIIKKIEAQGLILYSEPTLLELNRVLSRNYLSESGCPGFEDVQDVIFQLSILFVRIRMSRI
jgi:predicted nucleic acid-binding protein